MDKGAILAALNASGEVRAFRATDNWVKAFNLYNSSTGKQKNPNCSSCFREVLAWLQS